MFLRTCFERPELLEKVQDLELPAAWRRCRLASFPDTTLRQKELGLCHKGLGLGEERIYDWVRAVNNMTETARAGVLLVKLRRLDRLSMRMEHLDSYSSPQPGDPAMRNLFWGAYTIPGEVQTLAQLRCLRF